MALSREELDILKAAELMRDPVKWAEHELGVKCRWYQAQILHDPGKKLLVRIGRRAGKSFTMQIKALHFAATHPNSTQLIITPYENQVATIFDQMNTLLASSKSLKDCIPSNTKSPHVLTFSNGAKIKGFTSGAKSGQEAANIRGQRGDWIYMDEADYLTDKDIETIVSISLEDTSKIGLWMSSTPSGRRGKFWFFATQPTAGWKQFHYPSSVIPSWNADMEQEMRMMYSDNAYKQEVLAEFGDEEAGVFNKTYIDAARVRYKYVAYANSPQHRIIGVDWDKYGAATQIVVMQYDVEADKFVILNRMEIPIGEFTLTNAVEQIVKANIAYNVDYIYVDRGFGEHQVETLHQFGLTHPGSQLDKKVIGASFQETVYIIDPFTRERQKATLKPFAVNQINLLLEQGRLVISEYDDMIWKQLEQYRVKHTNINGQPVFEDGYDHALSAIMLCVYGFYQKYPNYMKTVPKLKMTSTILRTATDEVSIYEAPLPTGQGPASSRWDEPGHPPPQRHVEKPKQDSLFTRGRATQTDLKKGFSRRFW